MGATKLTEHVFAVAPGILRLTLPLPSGPRHVHCYFLRGDDGWTLVDTGLGLDAPWQEIFAEVDGPVVRIFVTHMHPDHVGGAEAAAAATGAPVLQGALDYEQCERVWGSQDWPERIAEWFTRHGAAPAVAEELIESGHVFADFVRFAWNPTVVAPGDTVDGWEVLWVPGHADGHLALHRDGTLIAGDSLLAPITPAIGLYPESRPDPLGDFYETLARLEALAPRVSFGGHGDPIPDPPARARAIRVHHDERLDRTAAALGREPRTGFEVSYELFGRELPPIQRRFAIAETLSHLERLVVLGRARRHEGDRTVAYTAPL
ncbi:MAG TPA: MBL fold metallo-hydrolase [Gaiellaceae bacterium]|nr:MBL fold metallo-hydrolase [Gaiellaceae bacterium]